MKENKDFQLFLNKFKQLLFKRRDQDIDTSIIGENLKMAVVLIGRPEVVIHYGSVPYLRYVCKAFIEQDINIFYLLARNEANIAIANQITERLEKTQVVEVTNRHESKSHQSKSVRYSVIRLRINGDHSDAKKRLTKIMKECSEKMISKKPV